MKLKTAGLAIVFVWFGVGGVTSYGSRISFELDAVGTSANSPTERVASTSLPLAVKVPPVFARRAETAIVPLGESAEVTRRVTLTWPGPRPRATVKGPTRTSTWPARLA